MIHILWFIYDYYPGIALGFAFFFAIQLVKSRFIDFLGLIFLSSAGGIIWPIVVIYVTLDRFFRFVARFSDELNRFWLRRLK